jgi:DnaJ like chaperone protein
LQDQHSFYEDFSQSSSQKYSSASSTSSSLEQAYALLEIPTTANKTEVKKAYRRSISRNHPDKLIAKGVPEAMIRLANEKTHKLTQAYEMICKNKGW